MARPKRPYVWLVAAVGNTAIGGIAWWARSIVAGLASVVLFNAIVAIAWRKTRARSGTEVPASGVSARENFAQGVCAFGGIAILTMGVMLPMRLPPEQRNSGVEFAATVVGFGLAFLPYIVRRKKG